MRILVDLTPLADNFSGIERYAAGLTIEMVKDEKNFFILIFKDKIHPIFREVQSQRNVRTVVVKRCNKLIFNQIKLPLTINKYKADCYLFLAFPVPILLLKKNIISTIHDLCCWDYPETMNQLSKWYFRISYKVAVYKCNYMVTVSQFSWNRIIDKLKYDGDKLWLVSCGIDEKFLNYKNDIKQNKNVKMKYNLPDHYILSLSTLEPRKNLRLLVIAYQKLIQKNKINVPLVLAGRKGWKMDELLSDVEENVKKNIIFTGFVDDEDFPVVYGEADLFVFPSKYEGFGIPPLESMACGTPVISSDAASLPEVLGDAAFYFESENGEDLCRKIDKYMRIDEIEKQKIIEVGYNQAQKFLWKEQADKLMTYIKENVEK